MPTYSYNYSIEDDFSNGIDQKYLSQEVNYQFNDFKKIKIKGDTLTVQFNSELTTGEQTSLDSLISIHDPNNYQIPIEVSTTINAGEMYTVSHFTDTNNSRKITIYQETTDSYQDETFTLNSDDYTIDNPSYGKILLNSFLMTESSYIEGSNIANLGTASASSAAQPASNAIDGSTSSIWYNNPSIETATGSWFKLDFGQPTGIYSIELRWFTTSLYASDVSIEYSNNDSNWTLAVRDQSVTYTSSGNSTGNYKFTPFTNPIFARYFRVVCNQPINSNYFVIREARFYQANGTGFSTSNHTTIYNQKLLRQIDTEIWKQINTSTIVGDFPSGTSTKILLSFDNQTTWVYWNGTAWTSSSLANINTSSMSESVFNSLTTSNYNSTNGLNSGTKTLDVAVNISTTDSTKTPVISQFVFDITTNIFQQNIGDSSIRIRNVTQKKTEFKNISTENKTLSIIIDLENEANEYNNGNDSD